MSACR